MRYTDDELLALGIKRIRAPGRGNPDATAYIYICATCGRQAKKHVLILDRPIYCNICKTGASKKLAVAKEEAKRNEIKLSSIAPGDAKRKMRFQKAAAIMSKYEGYGDAIRMAQAAYSKFDSVPEAIAAIALLHAGYKVIAQQPISDYRVDFILPDEKIVIEIDGSLYHKDAERRETRDVSIKYNLGSEWEIIHVPAESIMARPQAFERLIKKKIGNKNKDCIQEPNT